MYIPNNTAYKGGYVVSKQSTNNPSGRTEVENFQIIDDRETKEIENRFGMEVKNGSNNKIMQ